VHSSPPSLLSRSAPSVESSHDSRLKKIRIVLHQVENGQYLVATIPFPRRNREQVLEILDQCQTVELLGQIPKTGSGRAQAVISAVRVRRTFVAFEDDGFIAVAVTAAPALESWRPWNWLGNRRSSSQASCRCAKPASLRSSLWAAPRHNVGNSELAHQLL
jgi:hypothetical protein